jgi:hypothetical protein
MKKRLSILLLLALTAFAADLTLEDKEQFLASAKILKMRTLSQGITQSSRATLSDGQLTHDASVQSIDEFKQIYTTALGTEMNFKDTYKGNIAAYRLGKRLGLGSMFPPSVSRKAGRNSAAFTWWVDNVLMTEKERFFKKQDPPDSDDWNRQMYIVRVFDQLIYNMDRNLGNLVISKDWRLHMIDHTRAFRLHKDLKNQDNITRIDRQFYESLKALDQATLHADLKPFLTNGEIAGVLARRDRIIQLFDQKAKKLGEAAVFYDYLSTLE